MGSGKRFALLLCAEDSDYVKKKYGGYFGVFVGLLSEEGESWDGFCVAAGEFPDDDEIGSYDGFVITGSCSDAHGDDAWVCKLINLVKKLVGMKKKILGICFGHQILGRALGGKIDRSMSGWDLGVRTIHFSPTANLFPSLKMPNMLSIIECHRDEVWELPAKAEVIAWSNKTGIEMFRCGEQMMGIQGHPEYNKDILCHLIDRLVQRNYIKESYGNEMKTAVGAHEPDSDAWKNLCTSFLKGRLWR